jgi:hypothetical protein
MMKKCHSPSDVSLSSAVESLQSHDIDEPRVTGTLLFSCCRKKKCKSQQNESMTKINLLFDCGAHDPCIHTRHTDTNLILTN